MARHGVDRWIECPAGDGSLHFFVLASLARFGARRFSAPGAEAPAPRDSPELPDGLEVAARRRAARAPTRSPNAGLAPKRLASSGFSSRPMRDALRGPLRAGGGRDRPARRRPATKSGWRGRSHRAAARCAFSAPGRRWRRTADRVFARSGWCRDRRRRRRPPGRGCGLSSRRPTTRRLACSSSLRGRPPGSVGERRGFAVANGGGGLVERRFVHCKHFET